MSDLFSVAALKDLSNPLETPPWPGVKRAAFLRELALALEERRFNPPHTPLLKAEGADRDAGPRAHAERVAWFVQHGWNDPIDIDVGVPSLGCHVRWVVLDGNHRWAAALWRGDATIAAEWAGSVEVAKALFAKPMIVKKMLLQK